MEITMIEPTTELTVQDRAAVALGSSKTEQTLIELASKNIAIVSILDKAGREQAHGAAMELKRARTTIEKVSKEAREDATKFSRAVIAEAARLVAIVEPEETRLIGLRDEWDNVQELLKQEKERVERARVTAIHERISTIRGYHALALECRTSERVQILLDKLVATWLDCTPADFQEFFGEAQDVYLETQQRISALAQQKKADEDERARIKAEQDAEAAKLKAEREAQAAEAKKLADERAALDAERAAMAAERAAIAAKAETERMAKEAAEQAEQAAKELAEYQAAILVPVEPVAVVVPVEPVAQPVPATLLTVRPAPSAQDLIDAVAEHFCASKQTAAEWLDAADFTPYY